MVVANGGGVLYTPLCDMTGFIASLQVHKHAICMCGCPAAKVTLMDRLLRQELTTTTSRAVAGRMDDVLGLHEEYTSTQVQCERKPIKCHEIPTYIPADLLFDKLID